MSWKLLKKPVLLFLCIGFAVAATLNFFIFEKDNLEAWQEYYAGKVRNNLNAEIARSDEELAQIAARYKQVVLDTTKNIENFTTFPFYLFRNGQLIYWSDYSFVPEYQHLVRKPENTLLNTAQRQFIVNKLPINDREDKIEVFSLINLYQKNPDNSINYSPKIFSLAPESLSDIPSTASYLNIKDARSRFMFALVLPQIMKPGIPHISGNTILLALISLLLLGVYLTCHISELHIRHQYGKSFLLLAAYLIFIRLAMLAKGILYTVYESNLFNPKYLTLSAWVPSLGNALLNTVVGLVLSGYLVMYFYRSEIYYKIIKAPVVLQHVFSVLLAAIAVLVNFLFYRNLCGIYEESSFTLGLTLTATFSSFKIGALALYIASAIVFFFINHLLCSVFLRLNRELLFGVLKWLLGVLVGLFIIAFIDKFNGVYLVGSIYFLLLYTARLPRYFYNFKYKTNIYFFIGAFVSASIAIFVVFDCEQKKDLYVKKKFALRYLTENKVLGEYLLTEVINNIGHDTSIARQINTNSPAFNILKIIKSKYWNEYLNKYEADLLVFDINGKALGHAAGGPNYKFYQDKFGKNEYKTINPSVYFIGKPGSNEIQHYVAFINSNEKGRPLGNFVLELSPKDDFGQNEYPDWMMDERFASIAVTKNYSYAIFDPKNKLIFNSGDFNYSLRLPDSLLNNQALFDTGVVFEKHKHVGKYGQSGYKVVISSSYQVWHHLLANFSFLFLLLVLFIVLVVFLYVLICSSKKRNAGFSTKMQIYINVVFMLPLTILVITTVIILKSNSESNQEKAYLNNTLNMASIVRMRLKNLILEDSNRGFLKQEVSELAHDTKLDINFYNPDGRLSFTTLPLIYEEGFISDYINPVAYRSIIKDRENGIVLRERLSNQNYKAAYTPIKDQNGKILGILGISFFDADSELNQQVQDIVGSIMIIATLLLMGLVIISYFASGILMKPLKAVVEKLKNSNTGKTIKRLEWEADDEIGILVSEYNKMIRKLEDNKSALTLSQKQTAWREMARQVAHEIKNPLTPMKLSLQQLQRTLAVDNPKAIERIDRVLNSLSDQIDNISEIANSFSEFAKMPVPRSEVFDLITLIQKVADLYTEDDKIALNAYIKEKEAIVLGDRQFMSRMITNLIINGIQSVPAGKWPVINLRLYKSDDDKVIIEIQDNGSGIPEKYHDKVFRPNFTTKIGGSGFGLAMARRGVEHAGGSIWFETETDRGTTFFIQLPLARHR